MNDLNKIINDIYNLQNEITNYKGSDFENTKKIYELLIYSKELNITLINLIKYIKSIIKKYCVEQSNVSIKDINSIIDIEKHMNLDFIKNMKYNFSCRYTINNIDEKYLLSKTIFEMIQMLERELKIYNNIQIKEFRSKENREQYIQLINTFIIKSNLKKYNITLK